MDKPALSAGLYALSSDRGGLGTELGSTNFTAELVGWRHIWLLAEDDWERGFG